MLVSEMDHIHYICRYLFPTFSTVHHQGCSQGGGRPPPLFELWNPHHSIGSFVQPQKYVKNFVLAQKLWILRPFFKSLSLGEQYMPFSDNVVKQHTHFFDNVAKQHTHFLVSPPPFWNAGYGPDLLVEKIGLRNKRQKLCPSTKSY